MYQQNEIQDNAVRRHILCWAAKMLLLISLSGCHPERHEATAKGSAKDLSVQEKKDLPSVFAEDRSFLFCVILLKTLANQGPEWLYTPFSAVMATVISSASRQAASIFSFMACTTISPGVRIIFFTEDRTFPSAYTVR